MKPVISVCVTTLFFVLLAGCAGKSMKKVECDQKATFSGVLRYELFYGAPGFGEDTVNDEKEPTYILHTDKPFMFRDTALAAEYDISDIAHMNYDTVSAIQVRFDPGSKINGRNLRKLKDLKVVLECTLYGAHTGHHHAPAITEKVYSLKAAE